MSIIQARIRIAADGSITGSVPGATPGEHDAAIVLRRPAHPPGAHADAVAAIRTVQDTVARLPVLDPRTADEIVGYDDGGLPA